RGAGFDSGGVIAVKYKLIALDIDGTLLNDDHVLTDETKQAVKLVAEQGATIVLCTGRGAWGALPVVEELGLAGMVIIHNGAVTLSSTDRSIVNLYPFQPLDLLYYVRYCREQGIHYDLSTAAGLHTDITFSDEVGLMYAKYMIEPVR